MAVTEVTERNKPMPPGKEPQALHNECGCNAPKDSKLLFRNENGSTRREWKYGEVEIN